jgi:hypothetical protein
MTVIAVMVESDRATRVLFDCRDAGPDPADQRRIAQAIEEAIRLAQADEGVSEVPTLFAA